MLVGLLIFCYACSDQFDDSTLLLNVAIGIHHRHELSGTFSRLEATTNTVLAHVEKISDVTVRRMRVSRKNPHKKKISTLTSMDHIFDAPLEQIQASQVPKIEKDHLFISSIVTSCMDFLSVLVSSFIPEFNCSPLLYIMWWVGGYLSLYNDNKLTFYEATLMLAQMITSIGYGSHVDEIREYQFLKIFHSFHSFGGIASGVLDTMNDLADVTLKLMEIGWASKDPDDQPLDPKCSKCTVEFQNNEFIMPHHKGLLMKDGQRNPDYFAECESCRDGATAILRSRILKKGSTLVLVFLLCSMWLFSDYMSAVKSSEHDWQEILGRTWYVLIISMTTVGYGDYALMGKNPWHWITSPFFLTFLTKAFGDYVGSLSELSKITRRKYFMMDGNKQKGKQIVYQEFDPVSLLFQECKTDDDCDKDKKETCDMDYRVCVAKALDLSLKLKNIIKAPMKNSACPMFQGFKWRSVTDGNHYTRAIHSSFVFETIKVVYKFEKKSNDYDYLSILIGKISEFEKIEDAVAKEVSGEVKSLLVYGKNEIIAEKISNLLQAKNNLITLEFLAHIYGEKSKTTDRLTGMISDVEVQKASAQTRKKNAEYFSVQSKHQGEVDKFSAYLSILSSCKNEVARVWKQFGSDAQAFAAKDITEKRVRITEQGLPPDNAEKNNAEKTSLELDLKNAENLGLQASDPSMLAARTAFKEKYKEFGKDECAEKKDDVECNDGKGTCKEKHCKEPQEVNDKTQENFVETYKLSEFQIKMQIKLPKSKGVSCPTIFKEDPTGKYPTANCEMDVEKTQWQSWVEEKTSWVEEKTQRLKPRIRAKGDAGTEQKGGILVEPVRSMPNKGSIK
jgi:hypothetical protein